jgi:hypothetical protein
MSTDVKKTRVQVSTDDELIEEYKKEVLQFDAKYAIAEFPAHTM